MTGTTGLIIGKFLPFHKGHQYLIDYALSRVDFLTIMVGTLKREPISGPLRVDWVRKTYPQANVVHCDDENPQYPEEHPAFWDIWIRSIRKRCPTGPDYVFSSEDYGDELARRLGAKHILCDKERGAVPVSGTAIRSNPYAYWNFLPPPVKAYYVKRVVITGPESTGKTVLAQKLAEHFRTLWVPEYGRQYVEALDRSLRREDFLRIAEGQQLLEDTLAQQAEKLLLCDTDLMVTRFFSEVFTGYCDPAIIRMEAERRYDLHIVLDTDVPYFKEPQRNHAHLRETFKQKFIEELRQRHWPHILIGGPWEERMTRSIKAIEELFQIK